MDIRIEKGTRQYLNDCEEALLKSELGRKYFTGAGAGKKAVPEGIEDVYKRQPEKRLPISRRR